MISGKGFVQRIPFDTVPAVIAALCAVLQLGCKRETPPPRTDAQPTSVKETPATSAVALDRETAGEQAMAHDPAHPPIDCPLRKQGIDPTHLKPFEEVEKYIAFLERPDRAVWQKPDEVVEALALEGDETVDDLGAGSGYFAFRFAKALPQGRVIAADVEPEMIRHLHHRAMSEAVTNLDARLIQPDDPMVPGGVDLVFICDVLHHVANRPAWLKKIVDAMPSGGRLALIEFKEGPLPQGPPPSMKIPRAQLIALLTDAGLVLRKDHADLLPYQVFLEFGKP